MTLNVTHAFVSGVADDPTAAAAGEVLPSHWNANHVLTGAGGGPSINTAILYDKAGVIGEDANLEWDYTNLRLNVAKFNASTFTWYQGGTAVMDWGVTFADTLTVYGTDTFASFSVPYLDCRAPSGYFNGMYVFLTTDGANRRLIAALDGNNNGFYGLANATTAADVALFRDGAAGVFGINNGSSFTSPTGLRIYNTSDTATTGAGPTTNYERGVFDWTTTTNVLTIGTQKGGSGSSRNIEFIVGGTNVLDYGVSKSGNWTMQAGANFYGYYFVPQAPSGGNIPGVYVGLTTDTNSRIFFALDGSENPYCGFGPGNAGGDTFINRQAANVLGIGTSTTNASATVKALGYVATGDPGGTASTNTLSNVNSTTIGAGTGTVKMSSANNANNSGWLKCYIGTQVAWIPCWTTNAP